VISSRVLRIKLRRLDAWNARRRQHAARYHELLRHLPLGLPELIENGAHVYHQYVVRAEGRDAVREELAARGIGTGVHYPIPVHLQPACSFLGYAAGDLPHTERIAQEVLSLPMYPELTEAQLQDVAGALRAAVGEALATPSGAPAS
jgi:dTDP-4-amino-4,6-dideoxygalactose transaminase